MEYMEDEEILKEKYDDVLNYFDELVEKHDLEFNKEKEDIEGFHELKYLEE